MLTLIDARCHWRRTGDPAQLKSAFIEVRARVTGQVSAQAVTDDVATFRPDANLLL